MPCTPSTRADAICLTLINDMLDMAKIEAGKLELQLASVAANDICQASLTMIRELAFAKHQKVSCVITPDNLVLMADARRLKQILVNLLSNAVKFTPPRAGWAWRWPAMPNARSYAFEVWDEGIGIAAEDLGRLFKPFVQLDTRLTREQTGTGLGLSLVLRLAELHGGSVAVESTPGAGSRFSVTLPWRASTAEASRCAGCTCWLLPAAPMRTPPRRALSSCRRQPGCLCPACRFSDRTRLCGRAAPPMARRPCSNCSHTAPT